MKTIAIGNQKGGVGKTNLAVTLGHGLAMRGHRVLIIDLDTQGHVAVCLGLEKEPDLFHWLSGRVALPHAVVHTGRQNLDIIRSDASTADLKTELAGRRWRESILKKALSIPHPYDVVLLDCAPSGDVMHDNALTAADLLLVPARMDQLSMDGLFEIIRTLSDLRPESSCELVGIIPTFWVRTENEPQIQLEPLVRHFGNRVWPVILKDSKIPVANRLGKTLFETRPAPRSLAGYSAVLDRLELLIK
jgi:chromosome partitioning protein